MRPIWQNAAIRRPIPANAMHRTLELEVEFANFQRQEMRVLTPDQPPPLLHLAKDFPRLWKAPTTSSCERKRMLRLLIRDITVVNDPDSKLLHLQVRWQGGATDTIEVHRRQKRADAIRYSDMFCAKIHAMAKKYDDQEIADQLNAQALTSSTGKPFTLSMVGWIRFKHRIPGPPLSPGTLPAKQICERYGVSRWVVYYWIEHGIVSAAQRRPNRPYAITIDDAADLRLREWVANSRHLRPSSPTQTV